MISHPEREEEGEGTPSSDGLAATPVACHKCGLVQHVTRLRAGSAAHCARCGFQLFHHQINGRRRAMAFSLAALIFYFPSNIYPVVTADYYGMHSTTTICQGVGALFDKGQYIIAAIVFYTAILSPGLKICGLVFLSWTFDWPRWRPARAWVCRVLRVTNPWSMLEVLLLAVFVGMIEMGQVASVHPGRGAYFLTGVVALTLLATLSFDSRLLWQKEESREQTA